MCCRFFTCSTLTGKFLLAISLSGNLISSVTGKCLLTVKQSGPEWIHLSVANRVDYRQRASTDSYRVYIIIVLSNKHPIRKSPIIHFLALRCFLIAWMLVNHSAGIDQDRPGAAAATICVGGLASPLLLIWSMANVNYNRLVPLIFQPLLWWVAFRWTRSHLLGKRNESGNATGMKISLLQEEEERWNGEPNKTNPLPCGFCAIHLPFSEAECSVYGWLVVVFFSVPLPAVIIDDGRSTFAFRRRCRLG